jgi:site-specific DNA-cytosine methylase
MNLKMIDLFSGIGGIRIAFEENGVECVASSEIDKYACTTYFSNFGEYPMGNVALLSKKDFPEFVSGLKKHRLRLISQGVNVAPIYVGGENR